MKFNRRQFIATSAASAAGIIATSAIGTQKIVLGQNEPPDEGILVDDIPRGERPEQAPGIEILGPHGRVPLSLIIDDSTCLVNMAHYCIPQFAALYPERDEYKKPWQDWPREIPDDFVRKFGEWCRGHGVKGKYSIVPYPACVGWVDNFLPGWTQAQLRDSLKLVRDFMTKDWDIHPEMVSHTRVMNLKTGRPFEELSTSTMENSHPTKPVSVDYMAEYISYALQILKNADLPCTGFTTPGGFGSLVKSELSLGGLQALRATHEVEIPHYFKYIEEGEKTTQPHVEHASGLNTDDPKCCVNIIGGTGDWFGGWTGVDFKGLDESTDRFITQDAKKGRMVELIQRDEPAIIVCHWAGIYCNGNEEGFTIFKNVVTRVNEAYGDRVAWMKLSAIARYWAAKELTTIAREEDTISLTAPFAAPGYTLRFKAAPGNIPKAVTTDGGPDSPLKEVKAKKDLAANTWWRDGDSLVTCFDLPKGKTRLVCAKA